MFIYISIKIGEIIDKSEFRAALESINSIEVILPKKFCQTGSGGYGLYHFRYPSHRFGLSRNRQACPGMFLLIRLCISSLA